MENRGVIGVFVGEVNGATICSVSVRAEQSREELEEQVRREHSDANISLRRMYAFSCKGNVVDVETGLRKILCQEFGPYTPARFGLEGYTVKNIDKFMEYVDKKVKLIDSVIAVQEIQ